MKGASVVQAIAGHETALQAARRMRDSGTAFLVVTDADRRPLGVLTERDLTLALLGAAQVDGETAVLELMSSPAITVSEDASSSMLCELMGEASVRNLPIVNEKGELVGAFTADALLIALGERLYDLSRAMLYRPPDEVPPVRGSKIFGVE